MTPGKRIVLAYAVGSLVGLMLAGLIIATQYLMRALQ